MVFLFFFLDGFVLNVSDPLLINKFVICSRTCSSWRLMFLSKSCYQRFIAVTDLASGLGHFFYFPSKETRYRESVEDLHWFTR